LTGLNIVYKFLLRPGVIIIIIIIQIITR